MRNLTAYSLRYRSSQSPSSSHEAGVMRQMQFDSGFTQCLSLEPGAETPEALHRADK